ncbi:MAG: extracellular solute-binding protein [Candidatus Coatesbacteria bacterium]
MSRLPLSHAALVVTLFAGLARPAATAPRGPQPTVKLTVSEIILPRDDDMGIDGQAQREVLKAFRDKYPWIEVVRFGGIRIQGAAMDVGPLMAIAAGISPDVLYVNFRKSDSYIRQGFIQPLDEFIGSVPQDELADAILPSMKRVVYRAGPDGKPHWWAYPWGHYVIAMFYRKDLFHDAGLDPEKPPRTWDELLADCRIITNPAKGVYGMGFGAGPDASWNFYTLLLSAGAQAVTQDAKGGWRAAYDTPEAAVAVHFYARLLQEPYMKDGKRIAAAAIRDSDIYTMWDQGRIAIFQDYLSSKLLSAVNPEQIGIAPVPLGPAGKRGSEVNSTCMGMSAGIRDPRVREAAWAFMRFWAGPEANRIRTRLYVENGFGRFLNPAHLRKYGFPEYLKRVPRGWEAVYAQALAGGVPEPYGKNCDLIYWFLTKPLDLAIVQGLGALPPAEALPRIQTLLDHWVGVTNEKMLGQLPPAKRRFRNRVAGVVAIAILLAFAWAFRALWRAFTPEGAIAGGWGFRRYRWAYALLLPAVGLMAVWQYVPTVRGAVIAFMDYRIMGGSTFAGLDNFSTVLFDAEFWSALAHSLQYASLVIGLGFFAPIILALLLHEVPKGKVFFRVIFYLPAVVSSLVVIFLWKSFYDPTENGLLNRFLVAVALPPQGWLTSPRWAMLSVVLPLVWASMGPGSLLYLAALKTIPLELYEAAEMDGASIWKKLWHITIPTIKPLIIISFVGSVIGAFRASDFILAMTGGGPADATMVLDLKIFYDAFFYLRFGPATATAWVLGFILIGFTVYQMKRLSRMQFKAAEP